MKNGTRPLRLLLVEDNPGDVDLTLDALKQSGIACDPTVATDGVYATKMLRDGAKPELIILDLSLPRKSGTEVLRELKESEELAEIPVVVLTSSEADADVSRSYALGANCYVTKPVSLRTFQDVISRMAAFWVTALRTKRV